MATGELRWDDAVEQAHRAALKVPRVTAFFWIIKVLTTAQGEATSDYLVRTIVPEVAVALGFVGLVIALTLQFGVRRYVPWVYWLACVMVSVFGTMAADVVHVEFGVPYLASTIFFGVVLVVIFAVWYRTERTLAIHSIYTRRREAFYWATVLTTFALGTATGDLTATTFGLGFLASGVLFTVVIAVPPLARLLVGLNGVLAFWLAYILTRPLGASYADWMGLPHNRGGVNLGLGPVSVGLTLAIVAFVVFITVTGVDLPTGRQT